MEFEPKGEKKDEESPNLQVENTTEKILEESQNTDPLINNSNKRTVQDILDGKITEEEFILSLGEK